MVKLTLHSIAYEAKTLNLAKEGYTAFYVDGTNGLDIHDGGSWGQAFKTIQHAIDESESWATIFIRAGTYIENVNIPATKDSVSLIGDHPTGTIIRPSSNYGIYIQGEACSVSNLTAIGAEVGLGAGMYITGDYVDVKDCIVGNSVAVPLAGKGLYCDSEYGKITNVRLHQTDLAKYGIHIDDDNIEVSNCYLENAYTYAILFGSSCNWAKVFENTIIDAGTHGIYCSGASHNVAYHNNLIASSVYDAIGGNAHKFFENFYSVHTTDTNNNGLCDTSYSFTGNTDYQPVSRRNGWNQGSIGITTGGAGDATIAKQDIIIADTEKLYDVAFGVSPTDGSLASFLATGGTALGTRLPASKSLYDVIALDRLDNATYGLSALNTDIGAVIADTSTLFQKITKTITLSTGSVPQVESLFIVTGEIECYVIGYVDTTVTSAGALTLSSGVSGAVDGLIATTPKGNLLADRVWVDATASKVRPSPVRHVIGDGSNIIHYISVADATGGAITYYCWWRPLSSDGNVVAA